MWSWGACQEADGLHALCREVLRDRKLVSLVSFFFKDTATTEIYTLSLHDALPISIFTKMRSGGFGALTQDDQAVMMKLRQANGGGMGGGRGGRGGPGGPVGGPVGNGTQSNS